MSYSEAIWDEWYSVVGPLNKLTAWLTLGLSLICWLLLPVQPNGYNAYRLVLNAWRFVCVILASVFYLIILKEKIIKYKV